MNRHSAEDSPDFDPLARVYRWMEFFSFGPLLARCRFCYLAQASDLRRMLVLGDGDGRYTQRLLQRNPRVHITAVDSSRAMLAALQRRAAAVGAANRITLVHQDLRSFTPDSCFDAVVTHFSLDCLTEAAIEGLVTRILPSLNSGSLWIVSEFAIPAGRARAAAARILIGFLYFAFRVLTGLRTQQLPNYAEILVRHGFRRTDYSQWLGGLLTAEVWSLEPLTPHRTSDGIIL
jgi:ubiquinone/menaquinone biosynthesis C-methylase UbiE